MFDSKSDNLQTKINNKTSTNSTNKAKIKNQEPRDQVDYVDLVYNLDLAA